DNTPVGFVMLDDDEHTQRYFLWRFMIDERYQRMGFGRSAMNLIHEYVGTRPGGTKVYLSFVPADGVQGRSTRVSVTSKRAKWKMANSRLCSTSHVDQRAH
ncbi:MAG: GNAT family N-acetyltransferase, partial [Acidimicrobiia bacterium]